MNKEVTISDNLCKCGCEKYTKFGNTYINGHNNHNRNNKKKILASTSCKCECGNYTKPGNKFIAGHNSKKYKPIGYIGKHKGTGNTRKSQLCECNCGNLTKIGNKFIHNHDKRKIKIVLKLCGCNCGIYAKSGNRFIHGHSRKGTLVTSPKQLEALKLGAISQIGKTTSQKQKDAVRLIGYKNRGKKHSKEFSEMCRVNCIKRLEEGKIGWNTTSPESYPEKLFRKFLESLGAIKDKDFFFNYPVGRYRIDFAYIDEQGKRGIEIDGGQHENPEQKTHDQIRDEYLGNQGGTIFRIPVKELKRYINYE